MEASKKMGDPQVTMAFEKWLWLKWVAPTSETSICQWCLLVVFHPMNIYRSIVSIILRCSKYHLVMCYIAIEMTIYNGFSHWKRWFSLVMLVYQRVSTINFHKTIVNPVKLKWTLHQQSSHFFCEQGHHLDHSVGSSTMEGSCPALYKIGVKNLEKNVVYFF